MSLLQEKKSKNGFPIFSVGGVHLCSLYAPDKEAERWMDTHKHKVDGSEVVFILGLGCGYHLVEFAANFPNIKFIAIEKEIEQINWFWRNTHRQLDNISVVHFSDGSSKSNWAKLREDLVRPYSVFNFSPVTRLNVPFYSQILDILICRDLESLEFFEGIIGVENSPFLKMKIKEGEQGINIINIKRELQKSSRPWSEKEAIWSALGELVR